MSLIGSPSRRRDATMRANDTAAPRSNGRMRASNMAMTRCAAATRSCLRRPAGRTSMPSRISASVTVVVNRLSGTLAHHPRRNRSGRRRFDRLGQHVRIQHDHRLLNRTAVYRGSRGNVQFDAAKRFDNGPYRRIKVCRRRAGFVLAKRLAQDVACLGLHALSMFGRTRLKPSRQFIINVFDRYDGHPNLRKLSHPGT